MATIKKSVGSIFNNPEFFRLRDANRGNRNNPGNAQDIELNPMSAQAANPQQGQNPQPNNTRKQPRMYRFRPLFTMALIISLVVAGVALIETYRGSTEIEARWSRDGSNDKLTPGQVIFASIPRKLMWAWFSFFMSIQVAILETVFSYATFAASGTNTVAKIMRNIQMLFFVVAAVAVAAVMYGWLLLFI